MTRVTYVALYQKVVLLYRGVRKHNVHNRRCQQRVCRNHHIERRHRYFSLVTNRLVLPHHRSYGYLFVETSEDWNLRTTLRVMAVWNGMALSSAYDRCAVAAS